MRFLYSCIYTLLMPLVFARLLYRGIKNPSYRSRWFERLGFMPAFPEKSGCIWVHAVSVGETLAAVALIRLMQQKWPEKTLVVTTMTPTGSDQVRRIFGDSVCHVYAPYDLPCFVGRFLSAVKPDIAIIMETELWPNIIHGCFIRGIPTVVANARLSEKSLRGYQRVSLISRPMMNEVSCFVVQTQSDADRFYQLDVPAAKILVSGNIKFDLDISEAVKQKRDLILKDIHRDDNDPRLVLVAASTHAGEDEIILALFSQLLEQQPGLLLVLVPRHPERFNDVAKLCEQAQLDVVRRSTNHPVLPHHKILLADTMGELLALLGIADIAFIGGSLVPVGGHNMIEAAAWGVPVLTGSNLFNFQGVSQLMVTAGAMDICQDASQLKAAALKLLNDDNLRAQAGANALKVVEQNRGALSHLMTAIEQQIE